MSENATTEAQLRSQIADGFVSETVPPDELFYRFWRSVHGLGTFHGKLILWGWNR